MDRYEYKVSKLAGTDRWWVFKRKIGRLGWDAEMGPFPSYEEANKEAKSYLPAHTPKGGGRR